MKRNPLLTLAPNQQLPSGYSWGCFANGPWGEGQYIIRNDTGLAMVAKIDYRSKTVYKSNVLRKKIQEAFASLK